jgi:DNA-directed RNA polymerase specialized sigma24 family protein
VPRPDLAEALGRTETSCRKIHQRGRELLQQKLADLQ